MSLLRFDPYRSFDSALKRMNKIANEFENGITFETGGFNPRVDKSSCRTSRNKERRR